MGEMTCQLTEQGLYVLYVAPAARTKKQRSPCRQLLPDDCSLLLANISQGSSWVRRNWKQSWPKKAWFKPDNLSRVDNIKANSLRYYACISSLSKDQDNIKSLAARKFKCLWTIFSIVLFKGYKGRELHDLAFGLHWSIYTLGVFWGHCLVIEI